MKVAFRLGLMLLLTLTSLAAIPKQDTIGIYLFARSIEPSALARRPGRWKDLPLASKPIFIDAEILAYDFSKHAIKLEPEARLPSPSASGISFVVVVNGERIYPGAFFTVASSISCDLPVIMVDRRAADPTSPADILLIESGNPPQSSALGKVCARMSELDMLWLISRSWPHSNPDVSDAPSLNTSAQPVV